jgi:hypothetical protein
MADVLARLPYHLTRPYLNAHGAALIIMVKNLLCEAGLSNHPRSARPVFYSPGKVQSSPLWPSGGKVTLNS